MHSTLHSFVKFGLLSSAALGLASYSFFTHHGHGLHVKAYSQQGETHGTDGQQEKARGAQAHGAHDKQENDRAPIMNGDEIKLLQTVLQQLNLTEKQHDAIRTLAANALKKPVKNAEERATAKKALLEGILAELTAEQQEKAKKIYAKRGVAHGARGAHGRSANLPSTVARASIEIDYPVKDVVRLFTAEGEKVWIPGFDYKNLKGDGFNVGDVFLATASFNKSIYILMEYDEQKGSVVYSRYEPGQFAGTVELKMSAVGNNKTTLQYVYKFTATSEGGIEKVTGMTDERLAAQIRMMKSMLSNKKGQVAKWLKSKDAASKTPTP